MKIAVFHNLPPGGAKRVLYEEVKRLSKKHAFDLYVLSEKSEEFLDVRPFCNTIYIVNFKIKKRKKLKRVFEDLQILTNLKIVHMKIAKMIDSKGYDAVLVHPDIYTQAPFLLRYLKTPSVYYCHERLRIAYEKELAIKAYSPAHALYEHYSRKVKKAVDRKNARSATTIVTNSKFTKSNIDHAYNVNSLVIYPGVDTDVFKKITLKKKNQILFVGDPAKENGFDLIDQALEKNVDIKMKIETLHFKNIKKVPDRMLAIKYSESMVTINLAYNEPFGLSPLESIACGTPVIALNEAGYKETVDQRFGILIERGSEDLISAVKKISVKYSETQKEGAIFIKKNWNWESHVNLLEKKLQTYEKN